METGSKQAWYEALYVDFEDYDSEPYTQHTKVEVDFVQGVIGRELGQRILDVGCGTGRHSLELARRGYERVTGVDLSRTMLQQARSKAAAEELAVTFGQRDARELGFEQAFDVALMLCEGGFSLMETDEMDRKILRSVARALAPGGILIMTAPHAVFMLAQEGDGSGFSAVTLRETFMLDKDGESLACTQRYYTFTELKCLLGDAGFTRITPFAVGEAGYEEERMPAKEDYELGVWAIKGEGDEL